MALYYNLPVYKESYDLLITTYKLVAKVRGSIKHTLGERLKNAVTDVLLYIFESSKAKDAKKKEYIEKAINSLEKCKLCIRIFTDLNVWGVFDSSSANQKPKGISKQLTQWANYVAGVQ